MEFKTKQKKSPKSKNTNTKWLGKFKKPPPGPVSQQVTANKPGQRDACPETLCGGSILSTRSENPSSLTGWLQITLLLLLLF